MRPKGVIGLLVVILIVALGFYLLSDKFIERKMEEIGESLIGAKVEIDNLEFSLLGLSISFDRLQVTNPNDTWKNLFETGTVSFDMEAAALIRKKIIINDITLADLRLGTKRETDGRIPKRPGDGQPGWVEKAKESLMKQVESAPVLNLGVLTRKINVDSLMALFDIQSVANIIQVRQDADTTFKNWHKLVTEFKPKHDFQKIEQQINAIKPKEINNLAKLVSSLNNTKKLVNSVNALKKDFEIIKTNSTAAVGRFANAAAQFDNWIKNDFNAIKDKANIGEFNAQNVGKMLFGEAAVLPTIDLLEYVGISRKYMPAVQQFLAAGKVEKPPRFAGQNIRFPITDGPPDFLLEHIFISAATNQADTSQVMSASGEVNGITSHPKRYGKPLTFALKARLPQSKGYEVSGEFNHTQDIPEDRLQVKASGVRFGKISLPQRPYLPNSILAQKGDITANFNFIGDELDFQVKFDARPVSFGFAQETTGGDVIAKVIRSVFDDIKHLNLAIVVSGRFDDLGLKIKSNIDDILAQRISNVIGESAQLARNEIRKRIDEKVGPKKREALAFIKSNRSKIRSEVDKIEKEIDAKLAVLDQKKKELAAEIEKKKKGGLNKLKGIFKKN